MNAQQMNAQQMNAGRRALLGAGLWWAQPRRTPQWRYLAVAIGFVALGVFRCVQGSAGWGLLFLAVAVANLWLAWFAPSPGTGTAPAQATVDAGTAARKAGTTAPPVDADLVSRSLEFHRRRIRTWTTLAVGCLLGGALLVFAVPALGATAGLLALVALGPAARSRKSVRSLKALAPGS